ncbi:diaminopimelate epimerase [Buchnera aphidicola (Aphis glycines)]|uniref:Diaminopimelate epimerase n=1 Tax=Buchnera aphidicola (Aphis glycines) TaxID=1265350 RepID=A0A0M4HXG0_9GAMM|nr:diaminopimelate epimerase [Buchnera aphidicola]ALD15509.1 diaminopimelate epimerase [Buchnera aphidicola (Aphis glycines)]
MYLNINNKKKINFYKMHGLGNDFMVIESITQDFVLSSSKIKKLSNRNTGIGFDQLLLIEKSNNTKFDFHYRIFNSNGNEVEQCGNGARCVGLFLILKGFTNKKIINLSTNKKNIIINFISEDIIEVDMNEPVFEVKSITNSEKFRKHNFSVKIFNNHLLCSLVSIGNPHCVFQVESIKNAPVKNIGKIIEKESIFPDGINVGFMQILNKNHIKLRVYERNEGETQSCGSGACAAVAVGIVKKMLCHHVKVELLGGILSVKWKGFGNSLYMTGPAKYVYEGYIYI